MTFIQEIAPRPRIVDPRELLTENLASNARVQIGHLVGDGIAEKDSPIIRSHQIIAKPNTDYTATVNTGALDSLAAGDAVLRDADGQERYRIMELESPHYQLKITTKDGRQKVKLSRRLVIFNIPVQLFPRWGEEGWSKQAVQASSEFNIELQ